MSYIGENSKFSFKNGFCEPIDKNMLTSSFMSDFGKIVATYFSSVSVGMDNENCQHLLYAFCSGLAEFGCDVFICRNIDSPSFKFGITLLQVECGIYFSNNSMKISFFDKNGIPLKDEILLKIMSSEPVSSAKNYGKFIFIDYINHLYINNIKNSLNLTDLPLNAGISCGSTLIRNLWHIFFRNTDNTLIFQVSDDGHHVNAYTDDLGFISYEKLILCYISMYLKDNSVVFLPDYFHFAADDYFIKQNLKIKRFNLQENIPLEVFSQRFLFDPLYMCASIVKNTSLFLDTLGNLPDLCSAKRYIYLNNSSSDSFFKDFYDCNNRIIISRNGKNYLTLLIQSHKAETAAKLCTVWEEKLKKLNSCNNLFH